MFVERKVRYFTVKVIQNWSHLALVSQRIRLNAVRLKVMGPTDLSAVHVLDGGLAEEEEDVVLVLDRAHKVRIWKKTF